MSNPNQPAGQPPSPYQGTAHGQGPHQGAYAPGRPEMSYGGWGPPATEHGQLGNAAQQQASRSPHRRWPWVLGIVAAFLVGLAIPTGAPTVEVSRSGPGPLVGGVGGPEYQAPFTLEVSSELGREINVNYDNGTGGMDSAPRGTESTWSMTIPQATEYSSGSLTVSSSPSFDEFQSGTKTDTVRCRITDATGAVVDEDMGTGQNANANCFGY